MINNRQNGRRRGRGGQQPRGMAGNNGGNSRDNRQRGNAAQLLEKYKSLARDSQLAGDRVQTEYYLQFADHYFRVLGESRPRVDDQQRRDRGDDDGYGDDDGDDRMDAEMDGDQDDDQPRQQPAPQRARSDEQSQRSRPRPANDRPANDRPANDRPVNDRPEPRRERSNGRPRDEDDGRNRSQPRANDDDERIDFAVLPPAIGSDGDNDFAATVEDSPRPKRRVRRPRADEAENESAPAS